MYQTVGHQAIDLYADAMQLPLYRREIQGQALQLSADYQETKDDEVEDLYKLLLQIKVLSDFRYDFTSHKFEFLKRHNLWSVNRYYLVSQHLLMCMSFAKHKTPPHFSLSCPKQLSPSPVFLHPDLILYLE